jgi:hypothetical protein
VVWVVEAIGEVECLRETSSMKHCFSSWSPISVSYLISIITNGRAGGNPNPQPSPQNLLSYIDFRVFGQSPRSESLKNLIATDSQGESHRFESHSAHHLYLLMIQPFASGWLFRTPNFQPDGQPDEMVSLG